jgi:hypothetical protein
MIIVSVTLNVPFLLIVVLYQTNVVRFFNKETKIQNTTEQIFKLDNKKKCKINK